ncbi:MAG: segregation/condensation protein A [Firmicutes bacterium]|nr:segregation/condensation protein A [Bacillota bacterium]
MDEQMTQSSEAEVVLPAGVQGEESRYTVVLDEYTGPLDLLLALVKSAKINIADIFMSKVTEQYLTFMSQIGTIDMDRATEFLGIAAILLEIKSKSLLPRLEESVAEDIEDSKRELIRKIEEYKLIKEASDKLKDKELVGAYERASGIDASESVTVLKDMTIDKLTAALGNILARQHKRVATPSARKIVLDKFTVEDKIVAIRQKIFLKAKCFFEELFEGDYNKSEVITTFQALLELLKNQEVVVVQQETYGAIEIVRRERVGETETVELEESVE